VPIFDRHDSHVERREVLFQLDPGKAAAPGRVEAGGILGHQSLVSPLPGGQEGNFDLL
jgi:hypothetical protein